MSREQFQTLISQVTEAIAEKPIDASLANHLNTEFPAAGEKFKAIERACHEAIAAGWMCDREAGGIKFGRAIKPCAETHGFSVDVVDMTDVKGPHHHHPDGEVCMVMPATAGAEFDGCGKGWCVSPPDSAHHPTVAGGQALVLYMLPGGAIEFTRG
ncbi:MAG: DUF4863 family protein [Deltaproteobacteria bacterium]|nr:DUF4863 family protein [Deltaproteobacteria bacterium]